MKSILIVDDDSAIRWSLSQLLGKKYTVYQSKGETDTMNILNSSSIDLCILDVNLDNCNGFELCKKIRDEFLMPIIFITVNDDEDSLTRGIISGGDDYITKPFSFLELDLRIMAQLRRGQYQKEQMKMQIISGDYVLDTKNRTIFKNGKTVEITKTEYKIIKRLMENDGCLVTREMLLYELWDVNEMYVDSNTLSVNISRIRKKLSAGESQCPIETVYGIGYRWRGLE